MTKTVNQKVFFWASAQVGKQIGKGECWDLANSALQGAGASSSSALTLAGSDDYVWGSKVELKDVIPGDVLQYRDYEMTTTTVTDVTFTDNTGWIEDLEASVAHPHHTSIVRKNHGGGVFTVLEQNYKGKYEKVRSSTVRWNDAPTQETFSKKFLNRQDNGKKELATVKVSVTVSVSGTITAYRPKTP